MRTLDRPGAQLVCLRKGFQGTCTASGVDQFSLAMLGASTTLVNKDCQTEPRRACKGLRTSFATTLVMPGGYPLSLPTRAISTGAVWHERVRACARTRACAATRGCPQPTLILFSVIVLGSSLVFNWFWEQISKGSSTNTKSI